MIDYPLAKRLKEAGFPKQNFEVVYPSSKYPNREGQSGTPSLSELIEACGEEFVSLVKLRKGWKAISDACDVNGQTPDIAVANLWLALNTKT